MSENTKKANGDTTGSGVIREIDDETVRFISAGQKINDIETALRELVENSIDAGAKRIEVRLTKFGVDCIEVDDNGSGIASENFKNLAVRYHTSKISSYTNLQDSLDSFGFRGEALSCLSNISNLIITTKTKTSPTGSKLSFNRDGSLSKVDPVARDVGTTVILKNLFHSLPVRRRELQTSAKRQYDKIVKMLYEHVLARPHIRFSLCKKTCAKKEKDFTHGATTLEGSIVSIYGLKVLESLIPIRQVGSNFDRNLGDKSTDRQPVAESKRTTRLSIQQDPTLSSSILDGLGADSNEADSKIVDHLTESSIVPIREEFFKRSCYSKFARAKPEYSIYGYISKVNCGRNSTDCQFIYVNKKPCDIPKISRLINEVYKNHSPKQSPFYCLFIQVQGWAADFNVPRKRSVILQEENKLCNLIRDALEAMFAPSAPGNQKSCSTAQIPIANSITQAPTTEPKQEDIAVQQLEHEKAVIVEEVIVQKSLANGRDSSTEPMPKNSFEADRDPTKLNPARTKTPVIGYIPPVTIAPPTMPSQNIPDKPFVHSKQQMEPEIVSIKSFIQSSSADLTRAQIQMAISIPSTIPENSESPQIWQTPPATLNSQPSDFSDESRPKSSTPKSTTTLPETPISQAEIDKVANCKFRQVKMNAPGQNIKVHLEHTEDLALALARERVQKSLPCDSIEFSYAIHPNFNAVAEQELKLNLNKTSFEKMQVLGQFNRGFIITRLNKHLFIIDQHATDERANYEDQLEKCPLMKQPMVRPKPLYLTSIQENAIIDNLKAFQDRGFEFAIDTAKSIGFRVMMTSTSICKAQGLDEHLTKEDVEELIDVILESPNRLETYVLRKVKNVSATRACRKSVMIGDILSWCQMKNIVSRMSNLQNPWVCAHNRPTIRHLMDIAWWREP